MKKMVLGVAVAGVLLLAGCGNSGSKSDNANSSVKMKKVVKIKEDGDTIKPEADGSATFFITAPNGVQVHSNFLDDEYADNSGTAMFIIYAEDYQNAVKESPLKFHFTSHGKKYIGSLKVKPWNASQRKEAMAYISSSSIQESKDSESESKKEESESISESKSESASESSAAVSESKKEVADAQAAKTKKYKKYEDKLNDLNGGAAQWCKYDPSTNTVTWTGYADWKNWTHSQLQKSLDILQAMTYNQEHRFGLTNIKIVVERPDGTVVAKTTDINMDLQFVN
jgi:hypothetical protein